MQHEGLEEKRNQLKRGASAYQKEKAKRAAAVEGAVTAKENCLAAQKEVLEAATLEQVRPRDKGAAFADHWWQATETHYTYVAALYLRCGCIVQLPLSLR